MIIHENPDSHYTHLDALYLAGERVPPGRYRQVELGREVCLELEDVLPASLDGRVACYVRVCHTWEELAHIVGSKPGAWTEEAGHVPR